MLKRRCPPFLIGLREGKESQMTRAKKVLGNLFFCVALSLLGLQIVLLAPALVISGGQTEFMQSVVI